MQDFIPLKSIRNGIVETTDGRYLKILEIEPINFLLRSSEEQYPATYPSQLFFLKEGMGYEIVVLYEGEQHLARLLQPQEELKYIFVLPHSGMAQELILPNAPCLFSSVDYEGRDIPTVRFYAEVGGKSDVAAV